MDASDRWHEPVVEWWRRNRDDVLIPEVALAEITWLLHTRIGRDAELAFVSSIARGELETAALEQGDLDRAADLMS